MAFDPDDEILQDFLIEASEILEQLNEQLVDMEHAPDDKDLLNRIFRGFHTIKGGAGFLGLDALVGVCHRAEDVFNLLRNGERQVDPELMDVILPVLDVLNGQFDQLRAGQEPDPSPASVIEGLDAILRGDGGGVPPEVPAAEAEPVTEPEASESMPEGATEVASDDVTDQEFEAMLDAVAAGGSADEVATKADTDAAGSTADEITD